MLAPQEFTDVTYVVEEDAFAIITINRPERFNAFRGRTIDELNAALKHAWADSRVAAVILTGAGDKAFCAGGDVKERAETGSYGETESGLFEIQALHQLIRAIPKPVIAAVNGAAVGGGHVLHVLCDLSIASSTARFGQTGPRVGSFDAGFGTAYSHPLPQALLQRRHRPPGRDRQCRLRWARPLRPLRRRPGGCAGLCRQAPAGLLALSLNVGGMP